MSKLLNKLKPKRNERSLIQDLGTTELPIEDTSSVNYNPPSNGKYFQHFRANYL